MEHSNECKRNFVAVYDGSSSIENLKAKFCSTVANDVMLQTGVGVIRMWADEGSRLSRFRMLFTSFVERKCTIPAARRPSPDRRAFTTQCGAVPPGREAESRGREMSKSRSLFSTDWLSWMKKTRSYTNCNSHPAVNT